MHAARDVRVQLASIYVIDQSILCVRYFVVILQLHTDQTNLKVVTLYFIHITQIINIHYDKIALDQCQPSLDFHTRFFFQQQYTNH